MGYGCQKDFHIEDYQESFRRTSPVKRKHVGKGTAGDPVRELPLDHEERDTLLNLGALGLAGEGGEAIDMIKKHLFQNQPIVRDKLIEELGDVLWYIAALAEACETDIGEIALRNRDKLRKRYPDGFKPGGGIR